MYNVLQTPVFGIIVTIVFFNLGRYIQRKTSNPICNPLLIAIVGIILFLSISKIPYENYKIGADSLNFFLGPVTVVLAVPLYKQFELFKKHMFEIIVGIGCGIVISFVSVLIIGKIAN